MVIFVTFIKIFVSIFQTKMDLETELPTDELSVETKEWLKDLGLHYTTLSELLEAGPCDKVCFCTGVFRKDLKDSL